jgi:hypothetical protein
MKKSLHKKWWPHFLETIFLGILETLFKGVLETISATILSRCFHRPAASQLADISPSDSY